MAFSEKSTSTTSTKVPQPATNNKNLTTTPGFNSPYKVNELNRIPPPLLKFLVILGPTLRSSAKLVDIVMWKTCQPRQSVLMVLFWVAVCLWTWQVLAFGVPFLIVYKLGRDWLSVRTTRSRREQMEHTRQRQRELLEEKLKRYHDDNEDDERMIELKLQQQKEEEDQLVSRKIRPDDHVLLDDTLQDLEVVNQFIDTVRLNYKRVMVYLDGSNHDTIVSVASVLFYVTPVWILLNWLVGANRVLAIAGALLLISPSPWFKIMIMAVRQNVILAHILTSFWAYGVAFIISTFGFYKKKSLKSRLRNLFSLAKYQKKKVMNVIQVAKEQEAEDSQKKGKRTELMFQFEIYENQRWWLGVNWTTNMMPSERAAWTDSQLKPISKDEIQLPESTVKTVTKDGKEVTINKVWDWADGDWWIDMTDEISGKIDHNGWEYGNNAWKQFSGIPTLQTFTRRRRWCRRARVIEKEIY